MGTKFANAIRSRPATNMALRQTAEKVRWARNLISRRILRRSMDRFEKDMAGAGAEKIFARIWPNLTTRQREHLMGAWSSIFGQGSENDTIRRLRYLGFKVPDPKVDNLSFKAGKHGTRRYDFSVEEEIEMAGRFFVRKGKKSDKKLVSEHKAGGPGRLNKTQDKNDNFIKGEIEKEPEYPIRPIYYFRRPIHDVDPKRLSEVTRRLLEQKGFYSPKEVDLIASFVLQYQRRSTPQNPISTGLIFAAVAYATYGSFSD